MAQAGLHAMAATAVRKWAPDREWLMLGIVLGNIFPDADNLAVAVATLTGGETEGLHRTFTHSIFTIIAVMVVFYIVSVIKKRPSWNNLGIGLGIGILMHILFDLVIWFNGVELLWPLSSWVNLWENVTPPEWWSKFLMPAEFLMFALFFGLLVRLARNQGTDVNYRSRVRMWGYVQIVLFLIFLPLVYILETGFMTPYGAVYLLSLGLAFNIIYRMRRTIEKTGVVTE